MYLMNFQYVPDELPICVFYAYDSDGSHRGQQFTHLPNGPHSNRVRPTKLPAQHATHTVMTHTVMTHTVMMTWQVRRGSNGHNGQRLRQPAREEAMRRGSLTLAARGTAAGLHGVVHSGVKVSH